MGANRTGVGRKAKKNAHRSGATHPRCYKRLARAEQASRISRPPCVLCARCAACSVAVGLALIVIVSTGHSRLSVAEWQRMDSKTAPLAYPMAPPVLLPQPATPSPPPPLVTDDNDNALPRLSPLPSTPLQPSPPPLRPSPRPSLPSPQPSPPPQSPLSPSRLPPLPRPSLPPRRPLSLRPIPLSPSLPLLPPSLPPPSRPPPSPHSSALEVPPSSPPPESPPPSKPLLPTSPPPHAVAASFSELPPSSDGCSHRVGFSKGWRFVVPPPRAAVDGQTTFYAYRAQSDAEYPFENVNAANLAGAQP